MVSRFAGFTVVASAATFATVWIASAPASIVPLADAAPVSTIAPATDPAVHYAGCNEVRAAGKAPLYEGQPGYGEHMDGDGDGIACEDYR